MGTRRTCKVGKTGNMPREQAARPGKRQQGKRLSGNKKAGNGQAGNSQADNG